MEDQAPLQKRPRVRSCVHPDGITEYVVYGPGREQSVDPGPLPEGPGHYTRFLAGNQDEWDHEEHMKMEQVKVSQSWSPFRL